jgi:methionyl-tRNA formyltransferase
MRMVFFCGAESRYGLAHLEPLLAEHRWLVVGVVLATPERWQRFRQALAGNGATPSSLGARISRLKHSPRVSSPRRMLHTAHTLLFRQSATRRAQQVCQRSAISVWNTFDVNSRAFLDTLDTLKPDLLVSAAYPQIFKRQLLDTPRYGAVNSHPSLLPRCRGAHPVFWTLASGEQAGGVTMHYMEEQIDTGPIVAQVGFPLAEDEHYASLYDKVVSRVPLLINATADFLAAGDRAPTPQDDQQATLFRNDREIHHALFWSQHNAEHIHRLVRAADGKAFFRVGNTCVFVRACRVSSSNRNLTNKVIVPAGTVVDISDGIAIKVCDGVVTLTDWYSMGRKSFQFAVGQVLC